VDKDACTCVRKSNTSNEHGARSTIWLARSRPKKKNTSWRGSPTHILGLSATCKRTEQKELGVVCCCLDQRAGCLTNTLQFRVRCASLSAGTSKASSATANCTAWKSHFPHHSTRSGFWSWVVVFIYISLLLRNGPQALHATCIPTLLSSLSNIKRNVCSSSSVLHVDHDHDHDKLHWQAVPVHRHGHSDRRFEACLRLS
jgi:hypothetical protein